MWHNQSCFQFSARVFPDRKDNNNHYSFAYHTLQKCILTFSHLKSSMMLKGHFKERTKEIVNSDTPCFENAITGHRQIHAPAGDYYWYAEHLFRSYIVAKKGDFRRSPASSNSACINGDVVLPLTNGAHAHHVADFGCFNRFPVKNQRPDEER